MTVSFPTDLTVATITPDRSQALPSPSADVMALPSLSSAIENLGGSLTADVKNSMLAGAKELGNSGASFEVIKSYVNSELQASGVDTSAPEGQSGHFVDIMS